MKTNSFVFFDLDDTLINTKRRHYRVFIDYLRKEKIFKNEIDYSTYLSLRKNKKLSNIDLFDFLKIPVKKKKFNEFFFENIEHKNYLKYDTLIVDIEYLKKLKIEKSTKYAILSLRSNRENAIKQLEILGIKNIFEDFFFLKHNSKVNPKKDFFKNNPNLKCNLFIGDSLSDFEAAKTFNIPFKFVNTGIYNISSNLNTTLQYLNINVLIKQLINSKNLIVNG